MLKSEAERVAWSTILRYFWETHSLTNLANHQINMTIISSAASSVNRMSKIEIDEEKVTFKALDSKSANVVKSTTIVNAPPADDTTVEIIVILT